MRFILAIPTYNACVGNWKDVLEAIGKQSLSPNDKFIIDSSSTDATVMTAKLYGFGCLVIDRNDFNHGLTRQAFVDMFSDYDIIVFMTQDCLLQNASSLKNLVSAFDDALVSAAYGRQLAGKGSSLSEEVGRLFNYPPVSRVKTMADASELGLHAAFCSDSFAAYRISDVVSLGGFIKTDFGEDMLMAARILMAGKRVAYQGDALCVHSHKYSVALEFMRGEAIGLMHKRNPWLLENFGKAEARGAQLLASAPIYLRPLLLLQNVPKYAGYLWSKIVGRVG